jgi:hypothetical protein
MTLWLISWFIVAPDPRFVYGLLFGIFLLAYQLISFINDPINKVFIKCLIILHCMLSYYLVSKPLKQTNTEIIPLQSQPSKRIYRWYYFDPSIITITGMPLL